VFLLPWAAIASYILKFLSIEQSKILNFAIDTLFNERYYYFNELNC